MPNRFAKIWERTIQVRAEQLMRIKIEQRHGEILNNLDDIDTNIKHIEEAVNKHCPERRKIQRN